MASKHSLGTTTETQTDAAVGNRVEERLVNGVDELEIREDKGKGKVKGKGKADAEGQEHLEAMQHAEVGRLWLKRTLQKSGKTEEELAKRLWEEGLTAVLEVSIRDPTTKTLG